MKQMDAYDIPLIFCFARRDIVSWSFCMACKTSCKGSEEVPCETE